MRKTPLVLLILGLALMAIGGVMTLKGGPPRADPAIVAQCRDRMRDQGADMLAKCQEQAFATAMTATDADAAARAIGTANTAEVGGTMLGMVLLGLGLVLTIAGAITSRRLGRATRL